MIHLERKDGYRYTQTESVDIESRVTAEELYIPDGQESNWQLITEAEADVYEQERAARMEALQAEYEAEQAARIKAEEEARMKAEEAEREADSSNDSETPASSDDDGTTTESHTIEIECPHCDKTIYYTPATDSTEASAISTDDGSDDEAAIMTDDEL